MRHTVGRDTVAILPFADSTLAVSKEGAEDAVLVLLWKRGVGHFLTFFLQATHVEPNMVCRGHALPTSHGTHPAAPLPSSSPGDQEVEEAREAEDAQIRRRLLAAGR